MIGGVFLAIVLFSPDGLLGWWASLRARFETARTVRFTPGSERTTKGDEHDAQQADRSCARWSRPPSSPRWSRRRPARRRQPVKIGLLATLEGPFAAGGAGRHARRRARGAGSATAWSPARKIEIIKASSDAKPDVAVNATRKLVEQDKVDIMVGPLSGAEGIAVKDYSKTQPNITFINGSSGAQATTLVNPVAELLPLQHRRRAVDGGPRQGRARQGLQAGDGDRRGLRLPVLAGAGLHDRVLQARAARSRSRPGCRSAARTTPR